MATPDYHFHFSFDFADITGALRQTQAEVAHLREMIMALTEQEAAAFDSFATAWTDFASDLDTKLQSFADSIATLTATNAADEATIADLQTQITTMQTDVQAHATEVASAVDALTAEVTDEDTKVQ